MSLCICPLIYGRPTGGPSGAFGAAYYSPYAGHTRVPAVFAPRDATAYLLSSLSPIVQATCWRACCENWPSAGKYPHIFRQNVTEPRLECRCAAIEDGYCTIMLCISSPFLIITSICTMQSHEEVIDGFHHSQLMNT